MLTNFVTDVLNVLHGDHFTEELGVDHQFSGRAAKNLLLRFREQINSLLATSVNALYNPDEEIPVEVN